MQSREVPGAAQCVGAGALGGQGQPVTVALEGSSRGDTDGLLCRTARQAAVLGPRLALRWTAGGPTPAAWTPAEGHFGGL